MVQTFGYWNFRFGNCIQKVMTSQFCHFYFKFAGRTDFKPDLLSTTTNGFVEYFSKEVKFVWQISYPLQMVQVIVGI